MEDVRRACLITFVVLLATIPLRAQHNVYKINDALYAYYTKTYNNLSSPYGYRMADTLFVKSRQKHDLKAQCIALFLKVRYYYLKADYIGVKKEFERVTPFFLNTPYHQYRFAVWSYLVTAYINQKKYQEALLELSKFQDEARSKKNTFGIIWGFTMQGDIHYGQQMYRLALSQYFKAVHYGEAHYNLNMSELYAKMGRCYFHLRYWRAGEAVLEKSIATGINECALLQPYLSLLAIYCCEDTPNKTKIDAIYKKIENLREQCSMMGYSKSYYDECMYYYYKYYRMDEKIASQYLHRNTFILDSLTYYHKAAQMAAAKKMHKEASTNYFKYCNYFYSNNLKAEQTQMTWLVPQLEYEKVEHDKTLLLQSMNKMRLQQVLDNEMLVALNNERDEALLERNQKQHSILQSRLAKQKLLWSERNKRMSLMKQELEQKRSNDELMSQREVWRIVFICCILAASLVLLLIYIMLSRATRRRLKEEKDKAEKSEQLKSLFFQNMNHEIRSPLNAILGFNEVLNSDMSESLSPEQKSEFINMISTNSDLLLTLVNDVLDLSNFEGGTYRLTFVDVDIRHLCHTTLESIRGREAKGVQLLLKTDPEGTYLLHTDAQRLQQVLTNFLTNACKYTEHGSITLAYEVLQDMVRFAVIDTGCGVKEGDAEKVFERFQMLDKAKRGTGLGLHICRLISNLLHGRVYLDTSYKGGAKFVFEHPLKSALMLIIGLFCSFSSVKASNYPGPDDLKSYSLRVEREMNFRLRYNMADTLFLMAQKQKNLNVQCLALYQKVIGARFIDTNTLVNSFNCCRDFCLKSHSQANYKYIFLSWQYLLGGYMAVGKNKECIAELHKYQKMMTTLNDSFGISYYFFLAGLFYEYQHQYASAVPFLLRGVSYGKGDLYSLYVLLGYSYANLERYDEALKYQKKALQVAGDDESRKIEILCNLEITYCDMNNKTEATNIIHQLEQIIGKDLKRSASHDLNLAYYYYYNFIVKDKAKALEKLKLADDGRSSQIMAEYYYSIGDYEKAEPYWEKYSKDFANESMYDLTSMVDLYISRYDYQRSLKEKEKMTLTNIKMKLQRANSDKQLLLLQRQKNTWLLQREIINTQQKKAQLDFQNLRLQQQHSAMLKQRQLNAGAHKQLELKRQRSLWIALTTLFILAFCVALGLFFGIRARRKERQLRAEALAAEEAERAKNSFFLNVENEIRHPLDTIVQANLRLNGGSTDNLSSEERAKLLTELRTDSKFLTEMVNNVLDISKMESGTYRLELDTINVSDMCSTLIEEFKSKTASGVELRYEPQKDENGKEMNIELCTDVARLRFSLQYYLDNACKNTLDGIVTLAYEMLPDKIRFSVTDTGKDISEDNVEDISYLGRQKDDGTRFDINSHLVHLIAELLKGKAYIDTSCKSGARFVFEQSLEFEQKSNT